MHAIDDYLLTQFSSWFWYHRFQRNSGMSRLNPPYDSLQTRAWQVFDLPKLLSRALMKLTASEQEILCVWAISYFVPTVFALQFNGEGM